MEIGDYVLADRIGGSRAAVHRAVHRPTGRTVVVKRASWERPQVAAALAREAAILDRVQHPSLVRLLEVVEDLDGRALVLANAADGDLTRVLARRGAMAPPDAADLGARLAEALAALHDHDVVHRDVRPSNVLVDAELVPVLCDLDHALDPTEAPLPTDDQLVGDRAHVDPRLFDGLPQGPSLDLYGLGSVVWAAATGGQPRPDDLAAASSRLPPALLGTSAACLDGSIGTARAAATAFAGAATDARTWQPTIAAPHPTGARPEQGPPRRPPGPARHWSPPPVPPAGGSGRSDQQNRAGERRASLVTPTRGGSVCPSATGRWATAGQVAPTLPGRTVGEERPRRLWWIAGLVLAGLVVAGLTSWALLSPPPTASPADSGDELPVAVPPPPCERSSRSELPADGVLADLGGSGCSDVLLLRDGVLSTPDGRFALGRSEDRLLAGDWDGDGRWSLAVHRPSTGELFLFDAVPTPGDDAVSRPATRLPRRATPLVVEAGEGSHRVHSVGRSLTSQHDGVDA